MHPSQGRGPITASPPWKTDSHLGKSQWEVTRISSFLFNTWEKAEILVCVLTGTQEKKKSTPPLHIFYYQWLFVWGYEHIQARTTSSFTAEPEWWVCRLCEPGIHDGSREVVESMAATGKPTSLPSVNSWWALEHTKVPGQECCSQGQWPMWADSQVKGSRVWWSISEDAASLDVCLSTSCRAPLYNFLRQDLE